MAGSDCDVALAGEQPKVHLREGVEGVELVWQREHAVENQLNEVVIKAGEAGRVLRKPVLLAVQWTGRGRSAGTEAGTEVRGALRVHHAVVGGRHGEVVEGARTGARLLKHHEGLKGAASEQHRHAQSGTSCPVGPAHRIACNTYCHNARVYGGCRWE